MIVLGALIGAGFATGQEIYTFFIKNRMGVLELLISNAIIVIGIYLVLCFAKEHKIETYHEFTKKIFKK